MAVSKTHMGSALIKTVMPAMKGTKLGEMVESWVGLKKGAPEGFWRGNSLTRMMGKS